ncbi:MAG TPA: spore coat U domain-containing protein [Rhodanobacteraceae bacterium]|jgi:spore coat protein U-like protein|nr:spore coat U domain-containing protein [Rhodanobacteraceae bacterium]
MSAIARLVLPMLLFAAAAIAWPRCAEAQSITCSATMTNVSFGAVNPLSSQTDANATLSYTCENSANATRYATVCFSIGDGVQGGGAANPRRMLDGAGDPLMFQLWQNAAHTTVWGSTFFGVNTPVEVNVSIARRGSVSGSATLYGRVVAGQTTAVPGAYQDQFTGNHTALTINESNSSPPGSCSTSILSQFPFTTTATVSSQCSVSATTLDFGTVGVLLANVDGTSTVSVQCANGVAYQVGLNDGQHASGNTRRMQGPAGLVSYELYRNSARTQRWGNTLNSDTVIGSGTGGTQNLTVYGRVPTQTTPSAGTYNDTITVTVTY